MSARLTSLSRTACAALLLAGLPAGAQVSLDASFDGDGRRTVSFDLDSAATDSARRIFPAANGGYLVLGQSSKSPGTALTLTRLNPSGQIDTSFGSNGRRSYDVPIPAVVDVVRDSQGRLLFAGTETVGDGTDVFIGRLLPSGEGDASFGFLGRVRIDLRTQDQVLALAVGPEDRVLAVMRSRANSDLGWLAYAAAVDANGQNPSSVPITGVPEAGSAAAAWSSGRNALLVGLSQSATTDCAVAVHTVTLSPSGAGADLTAAFLGGSTLFNTSNGCTQVRVSAVAAVPGTGAALLAGHREDPNGTGSGRQHGLLIKVAVGGGLDTSFGSGGRRIEAPAFPSDDLRFHALAFDAQGRLLVAGETGNSSTPSSAFVLRRYLANGTPDSSFNGGSAQIGTSFPAANGFDSALASARDLRVIGPRILLAGRSRWTGNTDDDFAIAAFATPDAPLFADGFEN